MGGAVGLSAATGAVDRVAGLVALGFLARLLPPEAFGQVALASLIAAVLLQLVEFGPGWALMHFQSDVGDDEIAAHNQLQLASGLVALAGAVLLQPLIRGVTGEPVASLVIGVAGATLIAGCGHGPRLLLEKRFAFAQVAVVDAVAAIASVGVGIAAARRGWGAWSLVIGGTQPAVAYFLVQSLAFVALCPGGIRLWPVRRATLARFLRFGRPVWVEAQAVPIARQFDLAVVYALFGSAGAGVYDRAMKIAFLPASVLHQVMTRGTLAGFASIQGDRRRVRRMFLATLTLVSLLAALGAAVLFLWADVAVRLLLGPGWAHVTGIVRGLVLYAYFRALFPAVWPVAMGLGAPRSLAASAYTTAAVLVVSAVLLGPAAGILGVCLAASIAQVAGTIVLARRMGAILEVDAVGAVTRPVVPLAAAVLLGTLAALALPSFSVVARSLGLLGFALTAWGLVRLTSGGSFRAAWRDDTGGAGAEAAGH